jgi:inner membrane protein
MSRNSDRGHLLNRFGLAISSVYLGWTIVAKVNVNHQFVTELRAQNIAYEQIFTTPAPFNSLLWRAVVTDQTGYYEAYYSVLDEDAQILFRHYDSNDELLNGIEDYWPVRRLQWFSKGFYSVSLREADIVISDLRMGVEPDYVFRFKVGTLSNPHARPALPQQLPVIRDWSILRPIWQRIWDPSVILKLGK